MLQFMVLLLLFMPMMVLIGLEPSRSALLTSLSGECATCPYETPTRQREQDIVTHVRGAAYGGVSHV